LAYPTADAVLQQAQAELAVAVTSVAATDALTVQLVALLNKACQDLSQESWSFLTQRYSFSPTPTGPYALPADFSEYVSETAWDASQQMPMVGPLTEQQWEAAVVRVGTALGASTPFRFWQNKLYLYPTTSFPTGRTISFEYFSNWWVVAAAQVPTATFPTTDTVTSGSDVIWFPLRLAVAALKLYWKREKGFDSSAAQQDFELYLQQTKDNDSQGQTLSLNGTVPGALRLIGPWNAPNTGWGNS
jgi:hypothetical protein